MAFDFPATPTVGQAYTLNGVSYVWNGYAWMQGSGVTTAITDQVKAWDKVFHASGIPTFVGSYGVSSLTDTALGHIKHNFSSLYATTDKAIAIGGNRASSTNLGMYSEVATVGAASTETSNTTTTQVDNAVSMVSVGVLA